MNIKQTADASGVSARNIRYYEQAGLLAPARNPENDYRIYTDADVRTLKLIRVLRTLDMPVEDIRAVLSGTLPLTEAAERQRRQLEAEQQKLAAAAAFCTELAAGDRTAAELDVDDCLARMDSPAPAGGWFTGWVQDYRKMAAAEHKRQFTFTPDTAIATPQEFTAALRAYAEEKGMLFTLTKEGMYPEFSLDDIPYKAYRNPGKYRDEICCDAVHPEQLDTGLPLRREKLLRILHIAVPPVCTFAAILAAGWVVTGGAGWLWLAVLASAGVLLERCLERWL